ATRAPTTTPQPTPPRPAFEDHFDSAGSLRSWALNGGAWHVDPATHEFAQSTPLTRAEARLARRIGDAVIEVNFRRVAGEGGLGMALAGAGGSLPLILFAGGSQTIRVGAGAH